MATGFGEFLQNLHTTPVQMTGASGQWSMRANDTFRLLSVGSDFQQIHGTDSAAIFDEMGAQLRTDVGGGSQRFIGVFGEVDIFPIPDLEILGSVRYQNFFNFDGIDTIVGGPGPTAPTTASILACRCAIGLHPALRCALQDTHPFGRQISTTSIVRSACLLASSSRIRSCNRKP